MICRRSPRTWKSQKEDLEKFSENTREKLLEKHKGAIDQVEFLTQVDSWSKTFIIRYIERLKEKEYAEKVI